MDPVERKIFILDDFVEDSIYRVETVYLDNPIRDLLKRIYSNQNENDYRSGYFHLKHIQGPRRGAARNAIFYDIWLLSDSIKSQEDYDLLCRMNNSN